MNKILVCLFILLTSCDRNYHADWCEIYAKAADVRTYYEPVGGPCFAIVDGKAVEIKPYDLMIMKSRGVW